MCIQEKCIEMCDSTLIRLPSVVDVCDGPVTIESPFVTRPVLYLENEQNIDSVASCLLSDCPPRSPPSLLIGLLSDIDESIDNNQYYFSLDEIDELRNGFGRLLQESDCWIVTNGLVNDHLVQCASKALRQVSSERDYSSRHMQFIRENQGQLKVKPMTDYRLVAINQITKKDKALISVTELASVSESFDERIGDDFMKLDSWHSNYVLKVDDKKEMTKNSDERSQLNPNLLADFFVKLQVAEAVKLIDRKSNEERYITAPMAKQMKNKFDFSQSETDQLRTISVGIFACCSIKSVTALATLLNAKIPILVVEFATDFTRVLSTCISVANYKHLSPEQFYNLFCRSVQHCGNFELKDEELSDLRNPILSIHRNLSNISILSSIGSPNSLPHALLSAIVDSCAFSAQPIKLINLLIQFSCVDIAERLQVAGLGQAPACANLVLQALLYPERNGMVKYFLDYGIKLSTFFNLEFMDCLIRNSHNQDFLQTVVLGHLLGYPCLPHDTRRLLSYELNHLLQSFTCLPNLFNAALLYPTNIRHVSFDREGNVMDALTVWAIVMNRGELAKLLWAYSQDPVPLALIGAHIAEELAENCTDWYFYESQLRQLSKDFSQLAVELLCESHKESPHRSYDVLCYSFEKYNKRTAMQLAFEAGNREFIAHECCQRFVTRQMFGNVQFTVHRGTMGTIPTWFKTILCSTLIIPICWWVRLKQINQSKPGRKSPSLVAFEHQQVRPISPGLLEMDHVTQVPYTSSNYSIWSGRTAFLTSSLNNSQCNHTPTTNLHSAKEEDQNTPDCESVPLTVFNSPDQLIDTIDSDHKFETKIERAEKHSFVSKVVCFYSTPLAKYWLSLLFRLAHLILFGLTVAVPGCGNLQMDLAVWLWSFIAWIESLWVLYCRLKLIAAHQLCWQITNAVIIAIFLILMLVFKIVAPQPNVRFAEIFIGRVISSCFMLYLCYWTVFLYIPMSSTLGPLLVRVKLMVTRDFVNYLILITLIMGSFAVVVHVVVHPDFPNTPKLWHQAFHWAFFTLFITDISDLKTDESNACSLPRGDTQDYCLSTSTNSPAQCPRVSWISYVLIIQYLIIIKLISWPLLFALFAKTAKEVDDEADSIWKYQLFSLVNEFECHPFLPPPLTPIALLLSACWNASKRCAPVEATDSNGNLIRLGRRRHNDYYCYWRRLAIYLYNQKNRGEKKDEKTEKMDLMYKELKNLKNLVQNTGI